MISLILIVSCRFISEIHLHFAFNFYSECICVVLSRQYVLYLRHWVWILYVRLSISYRKLIRVFIVSFYLECIYVKLAASYQGSMRVMSMIPHRYFICIFYLWCLRFAYLHGLYIKPMLSYIGSNYGIPANSNLWYVLWLRFLLSGAICGYNDFVSSWFTQGCMPYVDRPISRRLRKSHPWSLIKSMVFNRKIKGGS